jgi:uncharacterized protein (DUF1697 family)
MTPQQSFVAPQTEQKAALAGPPSFTKEQWASFTEEQWEAAAAATFRAEIDRMDAVAAANAAAAHQDKFVVIDGLLYVKAWLVSEETESPGAEPRPQS